MVECTHARFGFNILYALAERERIQSENTNVKPQVVVENQKDIQRVGTHEESIFLKRRKNNTLKLYSALHSSATFFNEHEEQVLYYGRLFLFEQCIVLSTQCDQRTERLGFNCEFVVRAPDLQ